MTTPAQVIGENVRAAREDRGMTAEKLGELLGETLGTNPWPRQTVYLMEQGGRRLAADEVVALAVLLDVSVADLFTPSGNIDQVQVGGRSYPRERLLTLGARDAAWAYEIAKHTQALRRSFRDISNFMNSQSIVIDNIDNVLLGKPAEYEQPPPPPTPGFSGRFNLSRYFEQARKWYEPDRPEGESHTESGSLLPPLADEEGDNK